MKNKKMSKKKKVLIIGGCVIGVIAAVGAAAAMVLSGKSDPEIVAEATATIVDAVSDVME